LTNILKIYVGEKITSSTDSAGKTGYPLNLDPYLSPYKINSKFIKNLKRKTIHFKSTRRNRWEKSTSQVWLEALLILPLRNIRQLSSRQRQRLDMTPATWEMIARIDKWYCMELKNFCTTK
jgi:hypothetical protein